MIGGRRPVTGRKIGEAVSTASAVEQITSAVAGLIDARILIGVLAIGLITLGNLRGIREAGSIFAIPTYLFLVSALLMIGVGAWRILVLGEHAEYAESDALRVRWERQFRVSCW